MPFMSSMWGFLLQRLNALSKQLQKVEIDVYTVLELYDSLIHLIASRREMFKEFEENSLSKVNNKMYQTDISRKK